MLFYEAVSQIPLRQISSLLSHIPTPAVHICYNIYHVVLLLLVYYLFILVYHAILWSSQAIRQYVITSTSNINNIISSIMCVYYL